MTHSSGALVVPIGLLLVVLDVPGFGMDFANDTVGFALVAWAGLRLCPGGRWSTVGILATLAAVASVFGYGGPVSRLVVFGDETWTGVVVTEILLGAAVFAAVLWALAGGMSLSRRARVLVLAAASALVVAAGGRALLMAVDGGLAGTSGAVAQLCGVLDGLVRALAIALTFTFSHKR